MNERNRPHPALHGAVWVAALAATGFAKVYVGWWAIAVFVGIMIAWGLILESRGLTE